MCEYGNEDSSCETDDTLDCNNTVDAQKCCDVCYPKQNVTTRPVVGTLTGMWYIIYTH